MNPWIRRLPVGTFVTLLPVFLVAMIGGVAACGSTKRWVAGQHSPSASPGMVDPPKSASPAPPAESGSPTPRKASVLPVDSGEFTPRYFAKWTNGMPTDPAFFPIGVWLQDPNRVRDGKVNALNYKDAGVNTFVNLWEFPSRADSAARLETIRKYGLHAIASGYEGSAVDGTRKINGFGAADVLDGYGIGDEQDMSSGPHVGPADVSAAASAIRAADPSRPVYNNFGKAFSVYPWIGAQEDDAGLRAYCSQIDIVSSDYYAATDQHEPADMHTPDYYGRAVDHVRDLCGRQKPVWGFVETGHPGGSAGYPPYSSNGVIAADTIEQAVWSMLAHGANGIIYFVHDFFPDGLTEDGLFDHPANLAVVKRVNADIRAVAPILNAQRQPTGLTVDGADATLRADADGWYVIAAAKGNGPAKASFTIEEASGRDVEVVGENRTLHADANGTWFDNLSGWGHHMYRIRS